MLMRKLRYNQDSFLFIYLFISGNGGWGAIKAQYIIAKLGRITI